MTRLLTTMLLIAAIRCDAVTIYSNFGPGDFYNSGLLNLVGKGKIGPERFSSAMAVHMKTAYVLETIRVAGTKFSGPNPFLLNLAEDDGGEPGNVVESFSINLPSTVGIVTVDSVTNPVLKPGDYWLVMGAVPGVNQSGGSAAADGGSGNLLRNSDTGPWINRPQSAISAFDISGYAAVPEPSTVAGAVLGLIATAYAARRRVRGAGRGCSPW